MEEKRTWSIHSSALIGLMENIINKYVENQQKRLRPVYGGYLVPMLCRLDKITFLCWQNS